MYYTYVLIDPRTEEPFYVGKGSGDRLVFHKTTALVQELFDLEGIRSKKINAHLHYTILDIIKHGYEPIEEKWVESEDEDYCFFVEIYLIDHFRRYGSKRICNVADGGKAPKRPGRRLKKILL